MDKKSNINESSIPEEQKSYAGILDLLIKIGFIGLFLTFCLYIFGIISPLIPKHKIATVWHLSLHEFLAETGVPGKPWAWIKQIWHGDILNYIPVVFILFISLACLARVLPVFVKKRDFPYVIIILLQVGVIVLAASGLFVI